MPHASQALTLIAMFLSVVCLPLTAGAQLLGFPTPTHSTSGRTAAEPWGPTGALYPGEGSGIHRWIDGALGNDSNPGSEAFPWRTVDRIESASFAPGDLVHIRAGTYDIQGSLRLTGIAGAPLAWVGLVAEGPVTLRNSALSNVINVEDCHYLFLRGFEITHDNGALPYGSWHQVDGIKFQNAPSTHVSIDSCRIHHLGNVGVSSQAPVIRHIRVVDCEIHDTYTGIYWGYFEAPSKRYAHHGTIARNYIHDCPPVDLDGTGYGIQIKGGSRGNLIEDNVLVRTAGNTRAGIAVYHISTQLGLESDRNVIRGNLIRLSRAEGIYATEGALIADNVIVDSGSIGISVTRRDTGWGSYYGNLTVQNNTVYGVQAGSGQGMFTGVGPFVAPQVIANNLLLVTGPSQTSLRLPPGFAGVSLQNHCLGSVAGPALGVVVLPDLSDLLSTSWGDADFLFPTAAGSLVSAAAPVLASSLDFHGTLRDGAPDVGAFESRGRGNPGWVLTDGFKD